MYLKLKAIYFAYSMVISITLFLANKYHLITEFSKSSVVGPLGEFAESNRNNKLEHNESAHMRNKSRWYGRWIHQHWTETRTSQFESRDNCMLIAW